MNKIPLFLIVAFSSVFLSCGVSLVDNIPDTPPTFNIIDVEWLPEDSGILALVKDPTSDGSSRMHLRRYDRLGVTIRDYPLNEKLLYATGFHLSTDGKYCIIDKPLFCSVLDYEANTITDSLSLTTLIAFDPQSNAMMVSQRDSAFLSGNNFQLFDLVNGRFTYRRSFNYYGGVGSGIEFPIFLPGKHILALEYVHTPTYQRFITVRDSLLNQLLRIELKPYMHVHHPVSAVHDDQAFMLNFVDSDEDNSKSLYRFNTSTGKLDSLFLFTNWAYEVNANATKILWSKTTHEFVSKDILSGSEITVPIAGEIKLFLLSRDNTRIAIVASDETGNDSLYIIPSP